MSPLRSMTAPSVVAEEAFWSFRHSASWSTEMSPRSSAMRPMRKSLCVVISRSNYIGCRVAKTVELMDRRPYNRDGWRVRIYGVGNS